MEHTSRKWPAEDPRTVGAPESRPPRRQVRRRTLSLAAISLLAVSAAAYLFTQHPQHSLPYLPYLLLAACPLLHFFHHGRHH